MDFEKRIVFWNQKLVIQRIADFSDDRFDIQEIKNHVSGQLWSLTFHLDTIIMPMKWFTGAVYENHEMRRCKVKVLLIDFNGKWQTQGRLPMRFLERYFAVPNLAKGNVFLHLGRDKT